MFRDPNFESMFAQFLFFLLLFFFVHAHYFEPKAWRLPLGDHPHDGPSHALNVELRYSTPPFHKITCCHQHLSAMRLIVVSLYA